jgi:cardiolipin synthase
MFKGSTNFRLHRKAIIVDNQQAIYGSFNISDEYIKLSKNKNNWKDQNFIVSGEIVNSLNVCFIDD